MKRKIVLFLLAFLLLFTGCTVKKEESIKESSTSKVSIGLEESKGLDQNAYYYSKEDVANYIKEFGFLPDNYITKSEAKKMGWKVSDPGDYVIGGDPFGNREGRLPEGEQYYEADLVEGYGKNRGPSRLVFTKDGRVYYTKDHYETFEELE